MSAYKNVCVTGKPAGGRVREEDPKGTVPSAHDAGGISPGLLQFIQDVVFGTPDPNMPVKPLNFPALVSIDDYPGARAVDVHFEGRAADIYFNYNDVTERTFGNWLFDWCVANCTVYLIQGVIFGKRKWYVEKDQGKVDEKYTGGDHFNHVHVELNCDGANSP